MTQRVVVARALALALGSSALVAGLAAGCEPRDIYLFDPERLVTPDAGVRTPDAPPEATELDAESPSAQPEPEQPACRTPACDYCVGRQRCADTARPSVCHPVSGECALVCEPGAASGAPGGCPGELVCEPELELCVECAGDGDCDAEAPACDTRVGRCVECVMDAACPTIRPVCDEQRCVECVSDVDCAAAGEVCLLELARCVQCRDDADCRARVVGDDDDDEVRCLPGEQRCVECVDDGDCASDPERPFCSSERECEDERE